MPTVLIIDDERPIRNSFRGFLEDLEYSVLEADNGRVGLEIFKKERPHIVIVDLRMPGMNGFEVVERAVEHSPDTPVIIVSGAGSISDAVAAMRLGAWDYVVKPVEDLSVLALVIEKSLERSRLIRENRAYQEQLEEKVAARTEALAKINTKLTQEIEVRKKAEEAMHRQSQALEQSFDGIAISDLDGKIQFVNSAFAALHGYKKEELHGRHWSVFHTEDQLDRELLPLIKETKRSGRCMDEVGHVKKDGTTFPTLMSASIFRHENGTPGGIVSIAHDITERIKAEKRRAELETQLRQAQKMEAIGTLAGGIAHDFNNILAAIIGYTELSLLDVEEGDILYRHLNEVLNAGVRAKDLVQQILTFSRQTEQELRPVDAKLIVKEALKLLRASLPSTIEIRQDIKNDALVKGDITQIHQILMNLCSNSGHAMQKTGGVLHVKMRDVEIDSDFAGLYPDIKPGPYVKLTVNDTGHGMTSDVLERIFDPFYTTKDKGEGTGLGLSVVHGIVKSYGGLVTAFSERGKGSVFNVFLPTIKKELKDETADERLIPRGSEKILFVDDEKSLVDMKKEILESLGYEVTARSSSLESLELFKNQPDNFDLVITDMTMPYMPGDELAKELISVRPDIPVILCTGFSASITEEEAKKIGIREFVSKPILKRDIAEAIRKVLDER